MSIEEIVFCFTPSLLGTFDQPQPIIADGAAVIVLQRGEALVGTWHEDIGGFTHPANQNELASEALSAVISFYPDAQQASDVMRVFTCPEPLAQKFDWNWRK